MKIAREGCVVALEVDGAKISMLPSSWIHPEREASPKAGKEAPTRQPTPADAEAARKNRRRPESTLPTDPMERRLALIPEPRAS